MQDIAMSLFTYIFSHLVEPILLNIVAIMCTIGGAKCLQELGLVHINCWRRVETSAATARANRGRPPCTPGVLHGCRFSLLLPCTQTPALHH